MLRMAPDTEKENSKLTSYEALLSAFNWNDIQKGLDGLPNAQGLNIAYEAVVRHSENLNRSKVALRWVRKDRSIKDFTYSDLNIHSNRFANVLTQLGVTKGERVFTLAGRIPELYIAALGTLKKVAVFCPLFSVFGPEPIFQRLFRGDVKILVTTKELFDKKIKQLLAPEY